jgi:hypothetical protein
VASGATITRSVQGVSQTLEQRLGREGFERWRAEGFALGDAEAERLGLQVQPVDDRA